MIKNILWDVNGTLFDTYPAVTYAFSKTLNEMGHSIALNVIDGFVRRSFEECVETFSLRFKLDPGLLCHRFTESYRAIPPANQPLYPGVREVCESIHQHGGLNVAITHRSIQSTRRLIEAHNLSRLIDDIISAKQGYPHKPDPAMVLAALGRHALNPAETLLVGDRALDIQAGRAAGIGTCLLGKAALTVPADIQINDYQQLLELLNSS